MSPLVSTFVIARGTKEDSVQVIISLSQMWKLIVFFEPRFSNSVMFSGRSNSCFLFFYVFSTTTAFSKL